MEDQSSTLKVMATPPVYRSITVPQLQKQIKIPHFYFS